MNAKIKTISITGVFLLIFICGTIFIFLVPSNIKITYGLETSTEDGVIISFNVFEPVNNDNNKKAVIIGHGATTNKEVMKSFAIELASAGFLAVALDFRGQGQSTGEGTYEGLVVDIKAIKSYLNSRTDVDIHNLGYLGYSMGGYGQNLIEEDTDFKCFIATATFLTPELRKGNSTHPLNVLIIQAQFDEVIPLTNHKEAVSTRTGYLLSEITSNRIYGSFNEGNATMIYVDDNTNHLLGHWDPDFIREARDWVINTFPEVERHDENFYVNTRFIILVVQLLGGLGFFFAIIKPLSKVILRDNVEDILEIKSDRINIKTITLKSLLYSLCLGFLGVAIFIPLMLLLPLTTANFISALLFGQAIAIMILLWRFGKKNDLKLGEILKKPFSSTKGTFIRHLILGVSLAIILFLILYLSIGLNYLGIIPSLIKMFWEIIYLIIGFFVFITIGILTQGIIQNKFVNNTKNLIKIGIINFSIQFIYFFTYLFIFSLILGTFYYFGSFVPLAVPIFALIAFTSVKCYKNTGNIISGVIPGMFFLITLICAVSTL